VIRQVVEIDVSGHDLTEIHARLCFVQRFRMVCRSWCSTVAAQIPLPGTEDEAALAEQCIPAKTGTCRRAGAMFFGLRLGAVGSHRHSVY
jgi:hypothetical protein